MKKITSLILLAMAVTFIFSCQKEDVFNKSGDSKLKKTENDVNGIKVMDAFSFSKIGIMPIV